MRIPAPDHTKQLCPRGCGLFTVVAVLGDGREERLHCGTFRPSCPVAVAVAVQRRPVSMVVAA